MRSPHYFFWGNLVLRTPTDAWAVYELEGHSYPGLSDSRKIEVGERLEALAYTLETDFQIMRISRAFDADAYVRRALATLDPLHGLRERFEAHLDEHRSEFERRQVVRPEIYLAVRLEGAGGAGPLGGLLDGAADLWRTAASRLGFDETRGIGSRQVDALRRAEEGVYERVLGYLECERIGPKRLASLVRRAYTRGLGEPDADQGFAPQALSFLDDRVSSASSPTATTSCACTRAASPSAAARWRSTPSGATPTRRCWCLARCPRRRWCRALPRS